MNSRELWTSIDGDIRESRIENKKKVLLRSFKGNINYETFYKDFNPSVRYDAWIYDDKSERLDYEKKFVQMHPNQSIRQGEYIHWKNKDDIWLVRGVDTQYDYVKVAIMHRCLDNRLVWVDKQGLHRMPIFSQSKVLRDPLLDNGKIFLVDDSMEAYVQKNEVTSQIQENYRFVFGDRTVFKVIEIVNYYIDNTIKILLKKDENLSKDSFQNGIAYIKDYSFEITPNLPNGIQGNVGDTYQLESNFVYNGDKVDTTNTVWSIEDDSVATVSSSGLVTFNSFGVTNIIANFNGLETSTQISCLVVPKDVNYIFEPSLTDKLLFEESVQVTVKKMVNGVSSALNSTIMCLTTQKDFTFEDLSNNSFRLTNKTALDTNVIISVLDADSGENVEKIYRMRMW